MHQVSDSDIQELPGQKLNTIKRYVGLKVARKKSEKVSLSQMPAHPLEQSSLPVAKKSFAGFTRSRRPPALKIDVKKNLIGLIDTEEKHVTAEDNPSMFSFLDEIEQSNGRSLKSVVQPPQKVISRKKSRQHISLNDPDIADAQQERLMKRVPSRRRSTSYPVNEVKLFQSYGINPIQSKIDFEFPTQNPIQLDPHQAPLNPPLTSVSTPELLASLPEDDKLIPSQTENPGRRATIHDDHKHQWIDYDVLKHRIRPKLHKSFRKQRQIHSSNSAFDIFGLGPLLYDIATFLKIVFFPLFYRTSKIYTLNLPESEIQLRINKSRYSVLYFMHMLALIFSTEGRNQFAMLLPVLLMLLLASLFTYCSACVPGLLNYFESVESEQVDDTTKTVSFPIQHVKTKYDVAMYRRSSLPSPKATDIVGDEFKVRDRARSRSFSNSQPSQLFSEDRGSNSEHSGNESDNESGNDSHSDSEKSVTIGTTSNEQPKERESTNLAAQAQPQNKYTYVKSVQFKDNKMVTIQLGAKEIRKSIEDKVRLAKTSHEYRLLGEFTAAATGIIPFYFNLCETFQQPDTSTQDVCAISDEFAPFDQCIAKLPPPSHFQLSANIITGAVAMICTYLLARQFFTEMCLAELKFLKRFLYAKFFKKLTASSKASKADLPHFKLVSPSNVKIWIDLRSRKVAHKSPRNQTGDASANFLVILTLCFFFFGIFTFVSSVMDPKGFNPDTMDMHRLITFIGSREDYLLYPIWLFALTVYSFRFSALFNKTVDKYDCTVLLHTELLNLQFLCSTKSRLTPKKLEEYKGTIDVIKAMIPLYKHLEPGGKEKNDKKILMHPWIYKLLKVVILSGLGTVTTPIFGFKVRLWKL